MRVAIVGGGIAGAAAALELAAAGSDVVLLEAGERLGGLVVSFQVGGTPLECFYHHVFPQESHIRGLVDRLGLADRLVWLPSTMGVLSRGRIWPFTTPLDILRFGPLTPAQRLRLGAGGLALGLWRDWERLDTVTAEDWLSRTTGPAAVRELWSPLLRAKFGSAAGQVPAAWMWGRFDQRRGARKAGGERLGYLRGGFKQLFDALAADLERRGVAIRTRTRAQKIATDGAAVTGVTTDTGDIEADAVVFAGGLPAITRLVPVEYQEATWREARGLGVVCSVIETDRPLTDVYWTNVCDNRLGMGGIIEHTNLLPASDYGNRHVTYLGRYFTDDEPMATADPAQLTSEWLDQLAAVDIGFDPSSVLAVHPFRAPYAAPLVSLGYRERRPGMRARHVRGLYLATTAHIYPQDRGMSEGVRLGQQAAAAILSDGARRVTAR